MTTTTPKVHMISGNNDHVVCGATRGKRTIAVGEVTCALCDAMLTRMSYVDAHLISLEVLDAVQRGRFNAAHTTAARLRGAWLLIAKEKAQVELARLESSVGAVREAVGRYAAEAAATAPTPGVACVACAREACAQAGYPGIDKVQEKHSCGKGA